MLFAGGFLLLSVEAALPRKAEHRPSGGTPVSLHSFLRRFAAITGAFAGALPLHPATFEKVDETFHILYRNLHSKIGTNTAGTRFITLIFVTPSIFVANATINSDPTQVISAITASPPRYGSSTDASREMLP